MPDSDRMKREMMRLNQQLSERYPGVAFIMVSVATEENGQTDVGLTSNLPTVEQALNLMGAILDKRGRTIARIV